MPLSSRPLVVFDLECYKDYFLAMFRTVDSGKTRIFELYEGCVLDQYHIKMIVCNYTLVGFNSRNYDIPMLSLALKGATNQELKDASDRIILTNLKPWEFEAEYRVVPPDHMDHIDLIEVAPGQASLKLYGGRMHSRKLQDLPIEPSASISPSDRELLITYCGNDLETTIDQLNLLTPQLELRATMSDEYGIDLRSKSDAQIAEAVIRKEIERAARVRVNRPEFKTELLRYIPPNFISFQTPQLNTLLADLREYKFPVDFSNIEMPKALADTKISLGGSIYRLGIGGLHSSETSVAVHAADEYVLVDRDVASYYPNIILNCELYPKHLGPVFIDVYRKIVARRIAAKRAGRTVVANSLKIVCNGSFGKFGSPYSVLYSPALLIQTTITGQLALLMLIESLELNGISVVSANTDGVVIKCPNNRVPDLGMLIASWELETGFETEETQYESVYSRDVNNYVAIKKGGGVKLKGAYAPAGLAKNPTGEIAVEAVVAFLTEGIPLEDTINACTDIRKFLSVRRVNGGAVLFEKDVLPGKPTKKFMREMLTMHGWACWGALWVDATEDNFLPIEGAYEHLRLVLAAGKQRYFGKVVRWYYSTNEGPPMRYKTTNNKVAGSENSTPMMELIDEIPADLDYERYVQSARAILADIGWGKEEAHAEL